LLLDNALSALTIVLDPARFAIIFFGIILGLIGLPLMVMEVYLMISVETGHRLGDVMGDTEVIEKRV
jgi:hypothetical protein